MDERTMPAVGRVAPRSSDNATPVPSTPPRGLSGLRRLDPGDTQWMLRRRVSGTSPEDAELEALRRLHDHFARRWGQRLSTEVHEPARVTLRALRTGTYAELALDASLPTCLATLTAVPLAARVVLEFAPCILYPLFDWMLGGGREPSAPPARPMTEIETLLAERLMGTWCDEYAELWRHVLSLELKVERFEHNALRIRPFPPSAPLMLAVWDVDVGGSSGSVTCGVPWSAMLPLAHKLTADSGLSEE